MLGISDDKTVEGINPDIAGVLVKNLANLSNNPQKLSPSFLLEANLISYEGKWLIYIFVPVSSQVHRCNGKVFDRSADGDFELKSDEQVKNMYIRKNTFYSENTIYPFLSEADFVPGLLLRVRKIIKINRPDHPWNELSDKDFYSTSGLFRKDLSTGNEGFTLATLLLLGKNETIQSALPHYKIDALVRKQDLDRYDDRENIRCNLVEAYDKLMDFVSKHLPDKFYMEGDQRISLREKIFREVIANMLIHREYSNAFPASFIIYKNRVETKNANKPHLYGQLFPDTFQPFPKNPYLAQLFTQMGRSEELGTGLRNVFKYSKAYSGNDNVIFLEEDIFMVQVPLFSTDTDIDSNIDSNIDSDIVVDNVTDNVTDNVAKKRSNLIVNEIRLNNLISIDQLAKKLKVTRRTIIRDIEKMKNQNLISRIGPDKGGHWEIPENQ